MLNVRYCPWEVFLMLKKLGQTHLFLMRLDEVLTQNTVSKAVRSQRHRMLLARQAVTQVLRLSPPLKDIVALQYIGDNAGNVFGQILLVKPKRIKCYFVPRYPIDLVRHPHFSTLYNPFFNSLTGMTIQDQLLVNHSPPLLLLPINPKRFIRTQIIPPVQIFRMAIALHLDWMLILLLYGGTAPWLISILFSAQSIRCSPNLPFTSRITVRQLIILM